MSGLTTPVSDALSSRWRINVSGRVYGPYTGHQLKAFAQEGRIAPHSIVQAGEQGPWITAIDDPVLGQLFVQRQAAVQAQPAAAAETTHANFVIIADIRSRSSVPFEAALARQGEGYRLNPLVWLLHSDRSAGTLRNELVPHLGQSDTLLIVDATRSRTAWFNLGPEPDAKIRKVWKRAGDKTGN